MTTNFNRVVLPHYITPPWRKRSMPVHVRINYVDGKLSISGVTGALKSGNCSGGAGQNIGDLSHKYRTKLGHGWDHGMIIKLARVWEDWHLNTLRPYCPHQKADGWRELAKNSIYKHNYVLTNAAHSAQTRIKKGIHEALTAGKSVKLSPDDALMLGNEFSKTIFDAYPDAPVLVHYELARTRPTEKTIAGRVRPEEHPYGILCKPCPVCGYKYGSEWKAEEVPEEVLKWLQNLPDGNEAMCAWSSMYKMG